MLRILLIGVFLSLPLIATAQEAESWQVLYVTNRLRNPEIFARSEKGKELNLSNHKRADTSPVWSPDGARIAFCSNREGPTNVYTMQADGTEVTKVSGEARGSKGNCFRPSWSPDGTTISFQRREDNESDLFTIELESGRERKLTDDAWDPAWSPGGDKILFTGRTDKGWSLYTIEPDGGKLTEILAMENKQGFVYPSWSPDGKQIAFTKPLENGSFEIHTCDLDGKNLKTLTKEGRMNTHSTWTADGKLVVFLHDVDGSQWQWKSVDPETSKVEVLKDFPAEPYLHGSRPSYMPGKK